MNVVAELEHSFRLSIFSKMKTEDFMFSKNKENENTEVTLTEESKIIEVKGSNLFELINKISNNKKIKLILNDNKSILRVDIKDEKYLSYGNKTFLYESKEVEDFDKEELLDSIKKKM